MFGGASLNLMHFVTPEDPETPDSVMLLGELSATLARITGSDGRASFSPEDVRGPMAVFVVTRDPEHQAVGCGAIRPLAAGIAEVKRMYARPCTQGVGAAVLAHLEAAGRRLGYSSFWLETRRVNERAVRFYQGQGYEPIANFGKYVGRPEAVCFAKNIGGVPATRTGGGSDA